MVSNVPHVGHMPILEPISMANGMASVDWPGLGHVLHLSLPTWQPRLSQIYINHMDLERWSSGPLKDNVSSVQKKQERGLGAPRKRCPPQWSGGAETRNLSL